MRKIFCDFCGKEIKKGHSLSFSILLNGEDFREYEIHNEDCFARMGNSLKALFPFYEE